MIASGVRKRRLASTGASELFICTALALFIAIGQYSGGEPVGTQAPIRVERLGDAQVRAGVVRVANVALIAQERCDYLEIHRASGIAQNHLVIGGIVLVD